MGCHWHGVKFIATNLCLKRRRMSNNPLPWHTGKEKQTQPRTRRERERTKITGAINEIKKRKTEQINKCCSFEKINPVDRPLATVTKKREKTQITQKSEIKEKTWLQAHRNKKGYKGILWGLQMEMSQACMEPGSVLHWLCDFAQVNGPLWACSLSLEKEW